MSLDDRIALSKADLAASEQVLAAYNARFAVGTASRLDVAQQENVVAEQKALLPPLELQRRQMIDALALLTGVPGGAWVFLFAVVSVLALVAGGYWLLPSLSHWLLAAQGQH